MRLFLAIDPGQECLAALGKATKELRRAAPDAKWVREEGKHVTLVFLGEVEDEKLDEVASITREVVKKYAPLALRLEGGGSFGGRKPRVLWVGVRGDVVELCKMQRELAPRARRRKPQMPGGGNWLNRAGLSSARSSKTSRMSGT